MASVLPAPTGGESEQNAGRLGRGGVRTLAVLDVEALALTGLLGQRDAEDLQRLRPHGARHVDREAVVCGQNTVRRVARFSLMREHVESDAWGRRSSRHCTGRTDNRVSVATISVGSRGSGL